MVTTPQCNVGALKQAIESAVKGAKLDCIYGAEVTFTLPADSVGRCVWCNLLRLTSRRLSRVRFSFEGLFSKLDSSKASLGVEAYGCSVSTLEEVFLR